MPLPLCYSIAHPHLLTPAPQSIQERIKKLDFQDCKVRISNVDSQASIENIVIQVIGETSNKSGEPKKFVQTFVLAKQPSGYFVLNDILRYIREEADEEPLEPLASGTVTMDAPLPTEAPAEVEPPKPEPAVEEQPVAEEQPALDAAIVDKKLEEVGAEKDTPPTSAFNTPAEPAASVPHIPIKSEAAAEPVLEPEKGTRDVAEEEVKVAEVPQDPTPTPVVAHVPAPVAAAPEKPKEPPKPRSWAAMAAATAGAKAAPVAIPKTATPPTPHGRAAAPAAAPVAAPATAPTTAPAPAPAQSATTPQPADPAASKELASEWQTAGAEFKRQGRPQSMSATGQDKDSTLGYVKYVTEKVTEKDLRTHLAAFGEIVYFDINRTKAS